jgi:eukaryotic-like serine/threonine-protein kinase
MATIGGPKHEPTATRPSSSDLYGRYGVVGPLAKGGMAELLLAQKFGVQGFSRVVALKRVLPSHLQDAAFLEMFLDEARLAARLDHPNIVRIYELGQEGTPLGDADESQPSYFLAMEYLPGEDLRQLHDALTAAGIGVAPELAAHLIERVADALHFAHELTDETGAPLHLVHRDVSPSNVIVTYDGQVKVVDFGIAKAATNGFQTGEGVMKGKLGYLAPEQFTGTALDRRTDVFGLGILLWELLTNTRLFVRESAAATMAAASQGIVPAISSYRDDVGPELEGIIVKAARFQTAGEMRDALEHYLRTEVLAPTKRQLAEWMQSLGGARRAELKTSIARGTNVVASYNELRKLKWDDRSSPATPAHGPRRRHRPFWQMAAFALSSSAALAGSAWLTAPEVPAPRPAPKLTSAHLESDPPGAFVFIHGEPSGRVTPVTLSGLDPSAPLQFRLEKLGHAPASGELPLQSGAEVSRRVTLVANQGMVRFAKLPRGAVVRVGEVTILPGQEAILPAGPQTASLVVGGQVVATFPIVIAPGPQELVLPGESP